MNQRTRAKGLEIETENLIYEIQFGQIQIEITGRCNMRCQHCRAANQLRKDMPIEQIIKIIRFARQFRPDGEDLVLSGGEPLMHHDFSGVLTQIRASGEKYVTLTTNGSLITESHLRLITELSFSCFALSVSMDSLDPASHDEFRGHKGAFSKVTDALRLASRYNTPNLILCMRSTIRPSQIDEMSDIVRYARKMGCKRIGFSAIQPAGRALEHSDLWMSRVQKRTFLERIYELKKKFRDIDVTTNDPLKCLVCHEGGSRKEDELVFDGCGAAATTFNVNSDGVMTPCALLDVPMMNVFPMSVKEITEQYRKSPVVRNIALG
jgi:MoaA/NifB/PqqE/SkfB family radical SAM enzyme